MSLKGDEIKMELNDEIPECIHKFLKWCEEKGFEILFEDILKYPVRMILEEQERLVGKLVLGLPKEDLKHINTILKRHFGDKKNAKVQ